jgi:hypothetical protein
VHTNHYATPAISPAGDQLNQPDSTKHCRRHHTGGSLFAWNHPVGQTESATYDLFRYFPAKLTCQAPKPLNPLPINNIHWHKYTSNTTDVVDWGYRDRAARLQAHNWVGRMFLPSIRRSGSPSAYVGEDLALIGEVFSYCPTCGMDLREFFSTESPQLFCNR